MLKIQTSMTVQPMRHGEGFAAHGIRAADALMDPFLMADHYRMSQPTFGPHPHAGFSAVTYMFDDAETGFQNRDSRGNADEIHPGDVHWTVAGKGVVHDEVPVTPGQVAHGLQLFVNLAAANKHIEPYAIHIARAEMPRVQQAGGAAVKIGFGRYDDGATRFDPVKPVPTDATLLDVTLAAGASFSYPVPAGMNAFVYVVSGAVQIEGDALAQAHAASLGREGGELVVTSKAGAQFALFLGTPLNEPVVRHGPFAMTNSTDIQKAIADYQAGKMGSLT
jgi:redox-sensitive bicupin YhaK (pirin superfamily)